MIAETLNMDILRAFGIETEGRRIEAVEIHIKVNSLPIVFIHEIVREPPGIIHSRFELTPLESDR